MSRLRAVIIVVAVVLVACVALALVPRCWMAYRNSRYNDLRFDRKVWLSNSTYRSDNPRGRMAGNVKDRLLRAGMTRQQVTALLGKPDRIEPNDVYQYNLGNWGGCLICPDILDIAFDKSGRLETAEITEH